MRSALGIIRDYVLSAAQQAPALAREGYILPLMTVLSKCARSLQDAATKSDNTAAIHRVAELAAVVLHVCSLGAMETLGDSILRTSLRKSRPENIIEVLVQLARDSPSEQARFSALGTLAVWSVDGAIASELRLAGGAKLLNQSLEQFAQPRIQQQAASCILNCALDSDWRRQLSDGCLQSLLRVLRMSPPGDVVDATAAALRNLIQTEETCDSLFFAATAQQASQGIVDGIHMICALLHEHTVDCDSAALLALLANIARFGDSMHRAAVLRFCPWSLIEKLVRTGEDAKGVVSHANRLCAAVLASNLLLERSIAEGNSFLFQSRTPLCLILSVSLLYAYRGARHYYAGAGECVVPRQRRGVRLALSRPSITAVGTVCVLLQLFCSPL